MPMNSHVHEFLEILSSLCYRQGTGLPDGVRFLVKIERISIGIFLSLAVALTQTAITIAPTGEYVFVLAHTMDIFHNLAIMGAATFYGLTAFQLITAYGLLSGKQWARELLITQAVAGIVVGIIISLCALVLKSNKQSRKENALIIIIITCVIIAVIGIVILFYLHKPNVRQYFDGSDQHSVQHAEFGATLQLCVHVFKDLCAILD